jgi:hypothetical protein
MAIKYESGSTYFPRGRENTEAVIEFLEADEIARLALKNRREIVMLEQPTVMAVAKVLAERVRKPDVWIRSAISTLDRFSREVCSGDLDAALQDAKADPLVAEMLLQKYLFLHEDLTSVQLASLLFGPKLWWTINGIDVPWSSNYIESKRTHIANSANQDYDPKVRLLMLSLIGTGLTFDEVATIRIKDAGSLDSKGALVPNISSDPLALEFDTEEGRRITFLGEEARAALVQTLKERKVNDDDLLFAEKEEIEKVAVIAAGRGRNTIETVQSVNVTLCKVVGDFFRVWGIPGSNYYKENGIEREN